MLSKRESLSSKNSKTVEEIDGIRKIELYNIMNCDNYCEIKCRVHSKCATGELGNKLPVQPERFSEEII